MGFYESIIDCGDECYCVTIGSSIDEFKTTSYIFCDKHKPEVGKKLQYNFHNFLLKNTKQKINCIKDVEIIDMKKESNYTFIKLRVFDFNIKEMNLLEKNQLFIGSFNCEPNYMQENEDSNTAIIIDKYLDDNIHIGDNYCINDNVYFDWSRTLKMYNFV
jgi:hypothetical protein